MFTKVITLIALVGIAAASFIPIHAPVHHVEHHAPQPYKFGYSVKDKHGEQHREESGDGGNAVVGSYGFTDARGIHRQVNYVADHAGFRAQVKTNEPGTANQNPAAVHLVSNAPYAHGNGYLGAPLAAPLAVAAPVAVAVDGLGYGGLGYAGAGYGGLGYAGAGYGGYGLGVGGLGGLGYARYGY